MENPALKLHSILSKAYSLNNAINFKKAWAHVFEINENDTISLMSALSGMYNLLAETKELLAQNERLNSEKNVNFLYQIERAISYVDFNGTIHNFKSSINSETLTALSYIGESISFVYDINEIQIEPKKIDELINEIEDLVASITESTLPNEAKSLLVSNLNIIKDALFKYRFLGEHELKKALEQTIGSIFMNNTTISNVREDNNVSKFFNVIDMVNSLLTFGDSVKDYLLPFFDKLPFK